MNVLIIGASSLAGSAIYRRLSGKHEVTGTYHPKAVPQFLPLDIRDKSAVENTVTKINPDVIILTAAITAVDFCQIHREEAASVNTRGTLNVLECAKKTNAKPVFFSTDYIFDGKNGPYEEEDGPNPLNYYGEEKLSMEGVIQKSCDQHLIIRTCSIYGYQPDGLNFAMRVLNRLSAGHEMKVVTDQYNSPTQADNLAEGVCKLIEMKKNGIYNLGGSDYVNRFEFAEAIAESFNLDKRLLTKIRTDELKQTAPRPLRGGFKMDKIIKETGFKPLGIREGAKEMLRSFQENKQVS